MAILKPVLTKNAKTKDKQIWKVGPVQLNGHQVDAVNRMVEISAGCRWATNNSPVGSGKTRITLATHLIKRSMPGKEDLRLIVICQAGQVANWYRECEMFGIVPEAIISYQTLLARGETHSQNYVRQASRQGNKVTFACTEDYLELVDGPGVDLIFDECQSVKNKSQQAGAAGRLTDPITQKNPQETIRRANSLVGFGKKGGTPQKAHTKSVTARQARTTINKSGPSPKMQKRNLDHVSSVTFLSGTAFDKPQHVVNMLRYLGIITASRLTATARFPGAVEQVTEYCREIDRKQTEEFLARNVMGRSRPARQMFILDMFVELIQPWVSVECEFNPIQPVIVNAYYKVPQVEGEDEEDVWFKEQAINDAIVNFGRAVKQEAEGEYDDGNRGTIMRSQTVLETAVVRGGLFTEIPLRTLVNTEHHKILIMLNYSDNIRYVEEFFQDKGYEVGVLVGSVSLDRREEIIARFQEHNDECRVIVMQAQLAVGINLDDTHGQFPRVAFIKVLFGLTIQAGGRIVRASSRSEARVEHVYADVEVQEAAILHTQYMKGMVIRKTNPGQARKGAKFPGDYPSVYEDGRVVLPLHQQDDDLESLDDVLSVGSQLEDEEAEEDDEFELAPDEAYLDEEEDEEELEEDEERVPRRAASPVRATRTQTPKAVKEGTPKKAAAAKATTSRASPSRVIAKASPRVPVRPPIRVRPTEIVQPSPRDSAQNVTPVKAHHLSSR